MVEKIASHRRVSADEGLRRALMRRNGAPIGTPLQQLYGRAYPHPTPAPATTFWGADMEVVLPEIVSCEIHRHGVIEPEVSRLFIENIGAGTVVYDVGAHLGYYSALAAFLGGKVHAFEPARATLPLLEKNVAGAAEITAAAVWSEATVLPFSDFGAAHSAVNTLLSPKDEGLGQPEATYSVPVTTIDRHVESTGDIPKLIKIDAEGAELEVLKGAAETMNSAAPMVTIEVGDTVQSHTSRAAIDFARLLDYVPVELTVDGFRRHRPRHTYSYGNLLLIAASSEA